MQLTERHQQQEQTTTTASEAYSNFINSLDSEDSRRTYRITFPFFMRFCKADSYEAMLQIQPKKLEGLIRDYIIYLKQDKKLASASVSCYISCVSHFYQMNDFTDLNWKKLNKFKGKHRIMVEDVPYTRDQIKLLLERATLRDRCMILLMTSAGLRRGALPHLRVKHLSRISNFGIYRITVYKKESEEYVSYCTPGSEIRKQTCDSKAPFRLYGCNYVIYSEFQRRVKGTDYQFMH